ncbi:MAG: hypothetical protein RLZZ546_1521 [Bacteroidota bacterium]|jgi:hypothetical protein
MGVEYKDILITTDEIETYKREVTVDFNRWIPLKRAKTDDELKNLLEILI